MPAEVPARGRLLVYQAGGEDRDGLWVQAERRGLHGHAAEARLAVPAAGGAVARDLPVISVGLADAVPALLAVPARSAPAYRRDTDTLRTWALALRLGLYLVGSHHLVPGLSAGADGGVLGVWRAQPAADGEASAQLAALAAAMPVAAHALILSDDTVWPAERLLRAFLDAVADFAVRSAAAGPARDRPRARLLPWTARWAEALADPNDAGVPVREPAELLAAVNSWHSAAGAPARAEGVTEVELLAPDDQAGAWQLSFAVRAADGHKIAAEQVWQFDERAGAAGSAVDLQRVLLEGLATCARVFEPVEQALHEATPTGIALDVDQAWMFVSEAAALLDGAGVIVRLPDDLTSRGLGLRLHVGNDDTTGPDEDSWDLGAGRAAFSWEVTLGDDALSSDELDDLLAAGGPLIRWRDRWVQVPGIRGAGPGSVADAVARLRGLGLGTPTASSTQARGDMPLSEALALALSGTAPVPIPQAALLPRTPGPQAGLLPRTPGLEAGEDGREHEARGAEIEAEVVAVGSVATLLERLRGAGDAPPVERTPAGFCGELRDYQRRGVAWLSAMGRLGLGAVLADDMGLGKTVQLIGHVLERGWAGPHLVVCPTSVVGNWEREVRRFAPGLEVSRHHGPDRPDALEDPKGMVLTTYGTLRRDVEVLEAVVWDTVTLDEAQQVKNPQTAGARAARSLPARQKLALTGTPLENRLAELWSLLDVTNPGLLGSRSRFGERFVAPIETRHDRAAAALLRRLVAPFVMRRSKSDPNVIGDLPDKIERTVVCPLTAEQARLYRAAVERVLDDGLAGSSPIQRRGRILALLTELKQICNHPAQALGDAPATATTVEAQLLGRSGKLAATREIVAEALAAGQQILVFTQYVTMARLLSAQLAADVGTEVPVLHGGVPAAARDRMIASFQGETHEPAPPVLVLSLRAGGTGVNLTAATQVLHYDRWWNPAVEDQATDRAHRIGQRRTVEVHKLVTTGTLEERIAELLESKRALAEAVVGAGESWITELGDDELRELVALAQDASIVDLDDDEPWDALEEAG